VTDRLTDHATRSVTIGGAHRGEAKLCYCLWLQGVSLGPQESSTQTASRSLQPLLPGSLGKRQTDKPTDHAIRSVTIVEVEKPNSVTVYGYTKSGKTEPYSKIFKILFRKFTWRYRLTLLCLNVIKFVWWEIAKILCYLPNKKKQNFGCLSNCRYCADRAKICQGQLPIFGSKCSKFHPNRFNFGGVIAERVKAVLLAHRVFAFIIIIVLPSDKQRMGSGEYLENKSEDHQNGCVVLCANVHSDMHKMISSYR